MPRKPKPRPASGNESGYMAELLKRPSVLKLLLLWGTFGDGCGQDAIARRMKTVGVELTGEKVVELYHLAVANAKQPMGSRKKKQAA